MDDARHRYAHEYMRERVGDAERLALTPAGGHVALLRDLAAELGGPLGVIYVLNVARRSGRAGWYYSPLWELADVHAFLDRFVEFFERDGRHEVWIVNPGSGHKVIYDEHDWIYAYGALDALERIAMLHDLRPGDPRMPVPHSHHYHAAFDDTQDELVSGCDWTWYPHPDDTAG
jgi:hypothetical protein